MNRWTFVFLCAALCASAKLSAQTCTVNGIVLDPSGAAVVGADVQLQAASEEHTTTGARGSFSFPCSGNEPYQITIHAEGFAENKITGKGAANLTVHLRIADVH